MFVRTPCLMEDSVVPTNLSAPNVTRRCRPAKKGPKLQEHVHRFRTHGHPENEREARLAGQWIRHCVELLCQARGWVQEAFPMHNTILYSMRPVGNRGRQQETEEGHRQASHEQTSPSEQGQLLVIQA